METKTSTAISGDPTGDQTAQAVMLTAVLLTMSDIIHDKRRIIEGIKMCVAGGKRCEYADALSNVRRKTRNKFPDESPYIVDKAVGAAISRFLRDNPQLVKDHMPTSMPFQVEPSKKDVPTNLRQMLTNPRETIARSGTSDYREFKTALGIRNDLWNEKLTPEMQDAISGYTMTDYVEINEMLRKRRYSTKDATREIVTRADRRNALLSQRIPIMDKALSLAEPMAEPEKVYRFFRVPEGVKANDYIKKYLSLGGGFQDRGYLSTSLDSDYIASHIINRSGGMRNKNYVVFEILSNSGVSVHRSTESENVQSVESEVLLPRNSRFRIAGHGSHRLELKDDREDLARRYSMFGEGKREWFQKGAGISVPVIQMIDEKLIRDHSQQKDPRQ